MGERPGWAPWREVPLRIAGAGVDLHAASVADLADLAPLVASSLDELGRWLTWARPGAAGTDAVRRRLADAELQRAAGRAAVYGIRRLVDAVLVGQTSLHQSDEVGTAEVGLWVATGAAGEGLGGAAVAALVAAADAGGFGDVERLLIRADEANAAPTAIARRLGFAPDGVDRYEPPSTAASGRLVRWVRPIR